MADFQTLDLGRIMQTAAALKQAQAQTQTDSLRNRVLDIQAQQAQTGLDQQQGVDTFLKANPNASLSDLSKFGLTGVDAATKLIQARGAATIEQNRQLYTAANTVANSDDPIGAVAQVAPQFPQQYDSLHGQGAFAKLTPDQVKQQATGLAQHAMLGLVDPDKQYEATQRMVLAHYNQEGPGGEKARSDAKIAADAKLAQYNQGQENSRNSARITSENTRAGISPDGTVDPNIQKVAQQIADYRLPPPTAQAARTPRGIQLLGAVSDIDPTYDATQYGAKSAALKSLLAGKDGQTLDQVNTAVAHLSQLKPLLAALNSGDINIINSAKQAYQQATGKPAPTDASIVANMAAGEVNKVVTGGPGAEGDRDLARNMMQLKGSPEQQTEGMDNIIGLMAGRLNSVQNRFQQAKLGPTFDRMLMPETKAALASHAGGTATTPPAAAAPAAPAAVPTATGPNGQKLILQNGAWVPLGK